MTDFSMMAYRTRVLGWWGRRITALKDAPSWSTNRHEPRPDGAKTLALLIPPSARVRVERVQARWHMESFARTGQTALQVGLAVLESSDKVPDPRHSDLCLAVANWVRAGHPRQGPEFVVLARISERWIDHEEDTYGLEHEHEDADDAAAG